MNQEYFQKWTEMAKRTQKPFQAITQLNMKTLQNFSYIKPEDLASIKKPQELLEKQVEIAIENGHKTLDYLKKSFEIMENALLSMNEMAKEPASQGAGLTSPGNIANPVMDAARSVMNSPELFDPTKSFKEMMKPLFDHTLTDKDAKNLDRNQPSIKPKSTGKKPKK